MLRPIVASLSFASPAVEQQWRKVLFVDVKKKAHSKRYADIITNIANYQDAVPEESSTLIQRLGGGKWCMLNFCTAYSHIKHTVITNIRGFSAEIANQQIMEYADQKMREFVYDMQLSDVTLAERSFTKVMFISGLIKMYDVGVITCTAGPKETVRLTACIDNLLDQIDAGTMKAENAMISFYRELQRMHKAAKRLTNAS